jgi:DNA-binding NarL/FixJ family response regulator
MIRVLVADDHRIVREGVRRLLDDTEDIRITVEATGGDELLTVLATTSVDVVLLDVAMPGPGFLEVLRQLRERHAGVRVIVLSGHREEEYAVRALKGGAVGYVTKERSPEDLITAIRKAHGGGTYVSASLAEQLARTVAGDGDAARHAQLSDREYEVLRLLGAGKSAKEIAALLKLSGKTVSTYRTRMLEKLELKTTADLIRYAVQQGLSDM